MHENIKMAFLIWAIIFIAWGLPSSVIAFYVKKSQKRSKVMIDDEKLIRQSGGRYKQILWPDITKIKTINNYKGNVHSIKLFDQNRGTIYLCGFWDMEGILSRIKENIGDNVTTVMKKFRLDWEDPLLVFAIIIGTIALILPILIRLLKCLLQLF